MLFGTEDPRRVGHLWEKPFVKVGMAPLGLIYISSKPDMNRQRYEYDSSTKAKGKENQKKRKNQMKTDSVIPNFQSLNRDSVMLLMDLMICL